MPLSVATSLDSIPVLKYLFLKLFHLLLLKNDLLNIHLCSVVNI